jgi:hypothetical protein
LKDVYAYSKKKIRENQVNQEYNQVRLKKIYKLTWYL